MAIATAQYVRKTYLTLKRQVEYLLANSGGGGTVTSVAISGDDGIEIDSGSPITTAGTIALGINKVTLLAFLGVSNNLRETANIATTKAMNWNLYSVFEYTQTANTTLTDLNLPTGTLTKDILLILDGNFVPTFPTDWEFTPSSEAYDGSVRNQIIVTCVNGNSGTVYIQAQLQNLTT